jgi:hypothetical protein
MADRRSIADAVTLTPKLESFVKSGVPEVNTSSRSHSSSETNEPPAEVPVSPRDAAQRPRGRPRRPSRTPHAPADPHREMRTTSILDEMLVPITTKLRRRTVQALRRVHLEQKLRDAKPATQQEIVEEAIEEWLERHQRPAD